MKPSFFLKKRIIVVLFIIAATVATWLVYSRYFQSKEIQNVVLISIDTCRADYLSCYGYSLKTTPNIDDMAGDGIVFENAITPVPYTLPAHSSMLTGMTPPCHGVLDNEGYTLGGDNVTLAEILKDNGFRTVGFVSSFVLDSRFGLAQGFNFYDDKFEKEQNTMGVVERTGDETTKHVLKWLESSRGEKNFIFLHYYDPHFTYEPPEPFKSEFRNAPALKNMPKDSRRDPGRFGGYAGEIAFTDHCIGQVIDKLKKLGIYDSSLIIVTGDHGESLGEHREYTHGYFIYQSTIKVPLVFKLPGWMRAKRIKTLVSLVDIVPTVCSLLGIRTPAGIQGKDLSPYLNGQVEPYPDRYIFCQSLGPTVYMANSLFAVVNDRYKYIQTTQAELYDLIDDPQELNNLADKLWNRGRIMQDRLKQVLEQDVSSEALSNAKSELDEHGRRLLESLGYVGSSGISEDFTFDQNKEDPKDVIDYHVRAMEVGFLVAQDKLDMAQKVCQELISERPRFYEPYFKLAKVVSKQKRYEHAIVYLEKTLELKPDYILAYYGLADSYKSLGKPDKAIEQYLKILKLKPDNVESYGHLAAIFYEQGRFTEPEQYLTNELTANPSYVEVAASLAKKLLEKQQVELAYKHYLKILELDAESLEVLNALAWLEGTSKIKAVRNPASALKFALKACELTSYGQAEVVDTLAVAYAASGDFNMAVKMAEKAVSLAKADDKNELAQRITKRLTLYKSGNIYSE